MLSQEVNIHGPHLRTFRLGTIPLRTSAAFAVTNEQARALRRSNMTTLVPVLSHNPTDRRPEFETFKIVAIRSSSFFWSPRFASIGAAP